jgi:hypothetical protein
VRATLEKKSWFRAIAAGTISKCREIAHFFTCAGVAPGRPTPLVWCVSYETDLPRDSSRETARTGRIRGPCFRPVVLPSCCRRTPGL